MSHPEQSFRLNTVKCSSPLHNPAEDEALGRGHRPPQQPRPSEQTHFDAGLFFFYLFIFNENKQSRRDTQRPPVSLRSSADLVPLPCPPVPRHRSRSLAAVTQGSRGLSEQQLRWFPAINAPIFVEICVLSAFWSVRAGALQTESCQSSLCPSVKIWPGRGSLVLRGTSGPVGWSPRMGWRDWLTPSPHQ